MLNQVPPTVPFTALPPLTTKSEAATLLYPTITFDTALPQPWVDAALDQGFDVRPHFVWGYPNPGPLSGQPLPLTQAGADWLAAAQ